MARKNIDIQKEEMNIQGKSMAKSFSEKLIEILKTDSRFVDDEGELVKAAVIDRAWKIDRDLVKLLLAKPDIKTKFFDEIDGHWIFNINTFIEYISDKNFLANSYTRFRNKIGLNIDGKFMRERGEVSLVWPYKDCVLEGGQTKEEEKRKEIFFNEILAQDEIDQLFDPKVLTNWQRYTSDGEQKVTELKRDKNGTIHENLIIKGNNLLALHTLKNPFRGKVKLIYIDPPYNTGNDSFGYNDNFNHSSWLTFMKNRLEVARVLLSEDGVLFVQCDDNEQAHLKVLLDEVFRNNYLYTLFVQVRYEGKTLVEDMDFQKLIETIHVYRKTQLANLKKEEVEYDFDKFIWTITETGESEITELGGKKVELLKKDNYKIEKGDPYKNKLKEIWASGKVLDGNSSGRFFRDYLQGRYKHDGHGVLYKVYDIGDDQYPFRYFTGPKKDGATKGKYYQGVPIIRLDDTTEQKKYLPIVNFYDLADYFGNCRHEGGVELRSGKKPEELLRRMIELSTKTGDIVLDFNLGTGTTCAVAHKMGRQYIGIEQLDYEENDSVVRPQNVIGKRKKDSLIEEYKDYDKTGISKSVTWQGGGDFIYCELMKYNEIFIDKIQYAESSNELLKIWKDIAENSFLNWYVNPGMPEEAVTNFIEIGRFENGLEKQKKLLAELLNKNQLYVTLSEIDDADFKVSKEDKELNRLFFGKSYNG